MIPKRKPIPLKTLDLAKATKPRVLRTSGAAHARGFASIEKVDSTAVSIQFLRHHTRALRHPELGEGIRQTAGGDRAARFGEDPSKRSWRCRKHYARLRRAATLAEVAEMSNHAARRRAKRARGALLRIAPESLEDGAECGVRGCKGELKIRSDKGSPSAVQLVCKTCGWESLMY
jgi:hypothetical protein